MAYFTRSDGVDDRIAFPNPPDLADNWAFRLKARHSSAHEAVGFWSNDNTFGRVYEFRKNELVTKNGGTVPYLSNIDVEDGRFHLFELRCVAGVTKLYIDYQEMGTVPISTLEFGDGIEFNIHCAYRSAENRADYYSVSDFAFLEIEDNGTLIRKWDVSATNGTGSIVPDTVNGFDASMIGFASDDSQIVYYDSEEITPSHYARKVEISGLTPTTELVGFSVVITEDNVPAEFWTTVEDGGGDLRVSLNENGTNQLPIEVNICDTTNQILRAFVRFPVYSPTIYSCWLFYGKPGEMQHAPTSEYGQYSVWRDHWLVVHGFLNSEDATGNHTPTVIGNLLHDTSYGMQFSVSNQLRYDNTDIGNTDFYVSAVTSCTFYGPGILGGSIRGCTVFTCRETATDVSPTLSVTRDSGQTCDSGFFADSEGLAGGTDQSASHVTDVDYAIAGTVGRDDSSGKFDGTWRYFEDGVASPNINNLSLGGQNLGDRTFTGTVRIGAHTVWGNDSTSRVKYLRAAKFAPPIEHVELVQKNTKNPETFWTTSTPEDASVGGSSIVYTFGALVGLSVDKPAHHDKAGTLSATVTISSNLVVDYSKASSFASSVGAIANNVESMSKTSSFTSSLGTAAASEANANKTGQLSSSMGVGTDAFTVLYKGGGLVSSIGVSFDTLSAQSKTAADMYSFDVEIGGSVGLSATADKSGHMNAQVTMEPDTTSTFTRVSHLQAVVGINGELSNALVKHANFQALVDSTMDALSGANKTAILLSNVVVNCSLNANSAKNADLYAVIDTSTKVDSLFYDPSSRIDYFTLRLNGQVAAVRVNGREGATGRIDGATHTTRINGAIRS